MIDKIFHIADIHIRNYQRHDEYRNVFNELFKYLKDNATEDSVIYLAGDIVHSKNDISPELIDMVSYFLKSCADIADTILIAGNHDANLSNNNRLDALSAIVDLIDHPQLHYWKDNGVYEFGGVNFSVFSVFSTPDEWVKADQINGGYKIALHHGAVASSVTDMGYLIENETVKIPIFNGFDLALLGDVHKRQFLNDEKTIAYSSSLIQQNHGETVFDHGLLVWDLKTKKCEIVDIHNSTAYCTIEMEDGKITTSREYIEKLPTKLRLRIKYKSTSKSEINEVVSALKKKHNIIEFTRVNESNSHLVGFDAKFELGDVRDVEYQNSLICTYLGELDDSALFDFDGIREIHREINSELSTIDTGDTLVRNVIWKPLEFEFSNMFSYGEDNKIDFRNFNGIKGLFAPNTSGKSVLLDALTYCLFDKCSRTYRSVDVLNNKKEWFKCRFVTQLNNSTYEIIRHGKLNIKKGTVKVDVEFNRIDGDEKVPLSGKKRDDTNKIIRDYFGTYDDFLLTALSTQNDNKNFILKTQGERRDLLNSFLDISVFDDLYKIANKKLKDIETDYKKVESELNEIPKDTLIDNIKANEEKLDEFDSNRKELEAVIEKNNIEINELYEKIMGEVKSIDIDIVKNTRQSEQSKIDRIESESLEYLVQLKELGGRLDELNKTDVDLDLFKENKEKVQNILLNIRKCENDIIENNSSIKSLNKKIKILSDIEYDPNCEYCVNNPFLKDAIDAKFNLPDYELKGDSIQEQIVLYKRDAIELQKQVKYVENIINERENVSSEIEKIINKFEYNIGVIDNSLNVITTCDDDIATFQLQHKIQENNAIIREEIESLVGENKENNNKLYSITDRIAQLKYTIEKDNDSLKRHSEKFEEFKEIEHKYINYSAYKKAVNSSGAPYTLLKQILPVIEYEVNEILSQVVDFHISFESDEKNINCFIHYPNEDSWPVELGSGMERFVLSLAIRVGLINVSSLPRPNFIAIDEGFGVLDAENLASINLLFNYLKTQFDFILCITHLDEMKDIADSLIHINKDENNFSKIRAVA